MSIPGYTAYFTYFIWFSKQSDYDFAVAVAGGNSIYLGPNNAAALLGVPMPFATGSMALIDKTITYLGAMSPGTDIRNPNPSGILANPAVDSQIIPGQVSYPATVAGPILTMVWEGVILRINASTGVNPVPVNNMSQRRWLQGVELAPLMEAGTNGSIAAMSRVASRTNGGHGLAVRGQNTGVQLQHAVNENRAGLITATSWERFYFRLRVAGSATCGLWRSHGFPSAGAGAGIEINTDGTLRVEMIDAVSTKVVVGTIAGLVLNRYYRIDIFLRYDTVGPNGRIVIYINGVLAFSYQDAAGQGLGAGTRHTDSELGKWTATVDNQIEYDVDDWVNADLPNNVAAATLTFTSVDYPFDWLVGSHIRQLLTLSATTVGWTPANREVMNQGEASGQIMFSVSDIRGTTALANLDGTTDHNNNQDEVAQKFGPVGAIISDLSSNANVAKAQLGYALAGGPNVLATIPQTGAFAPLSVPYFPSGLALPPDIVPFHVIKQHGNSAATDITLAVQAVMEYLGQWGPEDGTPTQNLPQVNTKDFLHNCRYTSQQWGYLGGVTDAPVFAVGGTYVGNGTFQDVALPLGCHFLLIRNTSGTGSTGVRFFGASIGPCKGDTDQNMPNVRVWMDSTGLTKFTVSGTDVECNAAATNYQYIAFCDPGMRFNICGAYNHPQAGTSPRNNDISYISPLWIPAWVWVQSEIPSTASSTVGMGIKGPSSIAGVNGVTTRGVAIPQFGTLSAGNFASRSGIHFNVPGQNNYSLWRKTDAICSTTMLQIFSYVGNGVGGTRIIPFPDVTGRFPLFAHVQPTNATGIFRDPGHAGTNSSLASTMALTGNGIVAGAIDSISVGSLLNVNLVNYDVFIILGDNIGWVNGTFWPTSCASPYSPPPAPPLPTIAVRATGGLILGGSTAITLLKDISGIYTIVPGKTNDTLIDRQTGVASVDVKIPDPMFKTGYIGG
jgi:hypothetical protein